MNNELKSAGTKMLAVLLTAGFLSGNILASCKSSKQATNSKQTTSTKKKLNKTQKGAIVGASGGAVVGAVIGQRSGNTALGAILGATVGGAGGAVIGRRMDKQAEEMKRQMPNAQVERVGEGIKITFGSDILFDTDSYALKPETKQQLNDFAKTLNKYDDTDIRIEGHADATGPEDHNLKLSKQRADAVGSYLGGLGVKGTTGFGGDGAGPKFACQQEEDEDHGSDEDEGGKGTDRSRETQRTPVDATPDT